MTKILFLAADPKDTQRLRLGREISAIKEELRAAPYGQQFDFESEEAARLSELSKILKRVQPDIVHFSGHGSNTAEILLEDEAGNARPVPKDALKAIFELMRGNIRCVVLNACYAEPQATAIAEDIDCVVGMIEQVDDDSAIRFAGEFYRQLASGNDLSCAFRLGQAQIKDGKNLARICTYKANPAEIRFVTPPESLAAGRMQRPWRTLMLVFSLFLVTYLTFAGSILLVNLLTQETTTVLYGAVALATVLGVAWGMVWLRIYHMFS